MTEPAERESTARQAGRQTWIEETDDEAISDHIASRPLDIRPMSLLTCPPVV